jgi:hypothetical protein
VNSAIDLALEAIRQANPVPDPVDLADAMLRSDVFLTTTKETLMSLDTDQPTHQTPERSPSGSRRNRLALVGALVVAVVAVAVVATVNTGNDMPPAITSDDPAAAIEQYIAAYNSGDIDAVMEVWSAESVLTNHPNALEATGLAQIRAVQVQDLGRLGGEGAYSISNVEVTGDTVTWDHVWISRFGDEFCTMGHIAVIKDGKILTWTWGPRDTSVGCP